MRLNRHAAYLLGLLAAVNLLHYANRNVAFPFYEALRLRFGASEAELGLIGTVFMVPHAMTTVVVGWLGDRFDRRRVMATGVVIWSAAALLAAVAGSMGAFLAARALAGVGTAACVPVANAYLCDAFPEAAKARTVSVFNLGLFTGGVFGVMTAEAVGYPAALYVVGLPGLVVAVLVLLLDPRELPAALSTSMSMRAHHPRAALLGFAADARRILAPAPMRWTVIGAVLMAFAAGGYLAWFVDFLHAKGMTPRQTAILFGAALGGGVVGVLTGGVVGDALARRWAWGRQGAVAVGFTAALPCAVLAITLPTGPPFYLACCLLLFFISWYHGPVAATVDDLAPRGRESTAQGLYIFVMHLCGTAPASFLVGLLAERRGLADALFLPTIALAAAALAFVVAARAMSRAGRGVLQRGP